MLAKRKLVISVPVRAQVRSPEHNHLAQLLRDQGAAVEDHRGGSLAVHGASAAVVGNLAARHGIALHELVARQPSLEEAFMELTRDAVDYQPHSVRAGKAGRA